MADIKTRTCAVCLKTKTIFHFYKGQKSYCKDCHKAAVIERKRLKAEKLYESLNIKVPNHLLPKGKG